jgi:phosphatidate cytidylyltransferase
MVEAIYRPPSRDTLDRVGQTVGAWLLVAFFLGHAVLVRRHGIAPLFFLMLLVMVGDSAAYFVGTALGKHRLAPRVSPKKSIEGALGGLLVSALAGAVASYYIKLPHGPLAGFFIAACLNIAAQAGDLAESLWKRAANVKDSGTLFPGHGGMLDRVDSFLPTLPLYAAILALYGG